MRKQNAVCLAVLAGLLVAGRALAGNLDPTNAPGPTMHTLEEIYQKMNNLAVYTNVTYTDVYTNVTYTNVFTAAVSQTGQTNEYQAGDDGTYQKGVARPNPRFTIHADTNCVLDNLTGLIWARNANLAGIMNWSNAVVYCENLDYGGQTDWRLPNIKELNSLIDYSNFNPALPTDHPFAGVQGSLYWSGTSVVNYTYGAWFVNMLDGYVSTEDKTFYGSFHVWPVRCGQ